MAKIDLTDGYYRIPLSPNASLQPALVLPNDGLKKPVIGILLSISMGWKHSPPYFCAFTETCADLMNVFPLSAWDQPYQYAIQPPTKTMPTPPLSQPTTLPFTTTHLSHPLCYTDIYIDDFMVLAQHPLPTNTMNMLLHHFNTICRDPTTPSRCSLVSTS